MLALGKNDVFQACRDQARCNIDLRLVIADDLGVVPHKAVLEVLCPFHVERTPSFKVWRDHFYCFGCHVTGDIFDWLESTEGGCYSPKAAFHRAMQLAGLRLDARPELKSSRVEPQANPKPPIAIAEPWMQPIMQKSQAALSRLTKVARGARDYLVRRGLASVIDTLGFGVVDWELIQESLRLGAPKRIKSWYGRLVLPLSTNGHTVWFKVRYAGTESKEVLKAKNILRYDGPSVGFGVLPAPFHAMSLQHPGEVILVEGELNAASLVVALGDKTPILGLPGGRLPGGWEEHLKGRSCAIITDNDQAGVQHRSNLSAVLNACGINTRVLALRQNGTENLDANDILVNYGAAELRLRIEEGRRESSDDQPHGFGGD